MQYPKTIETTRLLLRPWREADAPALYTYAKDDRVGPAAGWPVHTSVEHSAEVIRTVLSAPGTYAVTLRGSDTPIGCIGFKPTSAEPGLGQLEIGYWLGVPFWGNGYMPETVRALLRCAFESLRQDTIWCSHSADNHNSRRVIKKCGFTFRFACQEDVPLLQERREIWYYTLAAGDWRTLETGGCPDGTVSDPDRPG